MSGGGGLRLLVSHASSARIRFGGDAPRSGARAMDFATEWVESIKWLCAPASECPVRFDRELPRKDPPSLAIGPPAHLSPRLIGRFSPRQQTREPPPLLLLHVRRQSVQFVYPTKSFLWASTCRFPRLLLTFGPPQLYYRVGSLTSFASALRGLLVSGRSCGGGWTWTRTARSSRSTPTSQMPPSPSASSQTPSMLTLSTRVSPPAPAASGRASRW